MDDQQPTIPHSFLFSQMKIKRKSIMTWSVLAQDHFHLNVHHFFFFFQSCAVAAIGVSKFFRLFWAQNDLYGKIQFQFLLANKS